jgi:hypothetical protein
MILTRYIYGPIHEDYFCDQEYKVNFVEIAHTTDPFIFYLYTETTRFIIAPTEKHYPTRWEFEGKFYTMKTNKDVLDFYNLIQTELTLENLA